MRRTVSGNSDTSSLEVCGPGDPTGPLGLVPNPAHVCVRQDACMETLLTAVLVTRKLETARIVTTSGTRKLGNLNAGPCASAQRRTPLSRQTGASQTRRGNHTVSSMMDRVGTANC